MKKILPIVIALISLNSCVTLNFPDSVNVEITVPEDTDVEKIEVMIDTLKAQAKDYGLTLEALIHKKNVKENNKKNKNKNK
jgi:hypothetical protein